MVVVVGQRSVQCTRTLGDSAALVCARNFPLARSTKYARSETYLLGLAALRFFLSLFVSFFFLFLLYLALSAIHLSLGTACAFFPAFIRKP